MLFIIISYFDRQKPPYSDVNVSVFDIYEVGSEKRQQKVHCNAVDLQEKYIPDFHGFAEICRAGREVFPA